MTQLLQIPVKAAQSGPCDFRHARCREQAATYTRVAESRIILYCHPNPASSKLFLHTRIIACTLLMLSSLDFLNPAIGLIVKQSASLEIIGLVFCYLPLHPNVIAIEDAYCPWP